MALEGGEGILGRPVCWLTRELACGAALTGLIVVQLPAPVQAGFFDPGR